MKATIFVKDCSWKPQELRKLSQSTSAVLVATARHVRIMCTGFTKFKVVQIQCYNGSCEGTSVPRCSVLGFTSIYTACFSNTAAVSRLRCVAVLNYLYSSAKDSVIFSYNKP
jgi:hypothetical protein